ncbi:unnamed protein product, partial [Ectocarpus sp. 13 AM-2016]
MVSSRIAPSETGENMAASTEGGAGDNKTAAATMEKKRQSGSGREKKRSHSSQSSQANDGRHVEGGNIAQSNAGTASSAGLATSFSEGRDRKHHRRRHRHRHGSKGATGAKANKHSTHGADTSSDTEAGGQEDKLKLLVDFIPYVGLGDATRDNMVRSILSAADAEELVGRDDYGNTLLILACQYRCKALVPLILARGGGAIDVDAVNSEGACALHFACYKDSVCAQTAVLLLERGAEPEVVEKTYGCTPLHYAAGAGDVNLCKRLIEKGAKANTWDLYQYTAVDYAKQSGAIDCVDYLEEVSAPGASSTATIKFSPGRGGIVTSSGVEASSTGFVREDSFDTVDGDDFRPQGNATGAIATGWLGMVGRQPSAFHEGFETGGEDDGEGFWGRQCDPDSGMAYYLNEKTGESMWEKDLLAQAQALRKEAGDENPSPHLQQWLRQQTHKARLIAFLGRHDPLKLMQV